MTTSAFARRFGMTHVDVNKLETLVASDVITLANLRELAEALDGELQYAVVPRTNLKQHVQERAEAVAQKRLRPIANGIRG